MLFVPTLGDTEKSLAPFSSFPPSKCLYTFIRTLWAFCVPDWRVLVLSISHRLVPSSHCLPSTGEHTTGHSMTDAASLVRSREGLPPSIYSQGFPVQPGIPLACFAARTLLVHGQFVVCQKLKALSQQNCFPDSKPQDCTDTSVILQGAKFLLTELYVFPLYGFFGPPKPLLRPAQSTWCYQSLLTVLCDMQTCWVCIPFHHTGL